MQISTLVADIHAAVGRVEGETPSQMAEAMAAAYTKQMSEQEERVRKPFNLYFSEVGDVCTRRLWYKYNSPSLGEAFSAPTRIKFLYGDMLESLVLQLARDAGHSVKREQERVEYAVPHSGWVVTGRIDAEIDGVIVDVKSVTKQSEKKFHDGLVDDPFNYYDQLNGYACALKNDDMGFLTIQKELGHIKYFHYTPDVSRWESRVERAINAVSTLTPPEERMKSVPQSATSKNEKLCTTCSYCAFKYDCWKELRAFQYSGRIELLTKVVDVPRVPEIPLLAYKEDDEE